MTVEIGILNSNCVVLAADSAVTVNSKKVYNNSNKIFQLSKCQPVGIMIYNKANIMQVPVEEIIKMYRSSLGHNSFDILKEYCDDFINFINSEISVNSQINQIDYLSNCLNLIINEYNIITEDISVEEKLNKISSTFTLRDVEEFQYKDIEMKYKQHILKHCMNHIDCSEENLNKLIQCLVNYLNSTLFNAYTGIVISGYGRKDLFPRLYHILIEGILDDKLKYDYNKDEILIGSQTSAVIKYFAQCDDIINIVEGINPELKNLVINNTVDTFNILPDIMDSEFKNISEELSEGQKRILYKICNDLKRSNCDSIIQFSIDRISGPMMNAVSLMSKEDLAELAESLIKVATLKRKASFELETVGGPVDVAVITKGDGFIWINRKFYFNKELNNNFFNRDGR